MARTTGTTTTVCSVPDCPNDARTVGLCNTHYMRQYRYGTTELLPRRPRRDRKGHTDAHASP